MTIHLSTPWPSPDVRGGNEFPSGAGAQRQAEILAAVAFAAERFLRSADWRSCIDDVLAKLGTASGVSRVYLFENHEEGDKLCATQTYEWVAAGIEPQLGRQELEALPYDSEALEPLRGTVAVGLPLVGVIREMPPAARSVLEPQHIVSIAIVPIITHDTWIGFLGFDDCVHERRWSVVEIDALKAASGILGAAIQRTNSETALRQKEHQLRQAQKMEAVGNLAGGIAHDFNNVLQIIWLCAERLRARIPSDSALQTEVDTIGESVRRARALPNQLLAFARRQVVQRDLQDLNDSVKEIVDLVRRVIGEDVIIEFSRDQTPTLAEVDPVQLQQAVMNLILNARDALPEGGRVQVATRTESVPCERVLLHATLPPGRYAVVSVEDEGIGMAPEIVSRVFEPFFTTKPNGHGIGLATVYGIAEQHGGRIVVDSVQGQGSRFAIYFPAADAAATVASSRENVDCELRGSESLLIVEDEDALRDAIAALLTDLGYRVTTAPDGATAVELAEGPFDLLLSDVVMPRMDGVTLAGLLRAKSPSMKVLYMSGHAFDVLERRGIDPASLSLLRKPFSAPELARHVRAALDRR